MNIAFPQIIFGSLIAGIVGAGIHLILGGKPLRLVLSLIFSIIGFWLGQALSSQYSISIIRLGTINLGFALVASLLFGVFGYWIAGENRTEKEKG